MKPISFVHKRHRFIKLLHDTKSSLKLYMNRTQDVLNIIDEDTNINILLEPYQFFWEGAQGYELHNLIIKEYNTLDYDLRFKIINMIHSAEIMIISNYNFESVNIGSVSSKYPLIFVHIPRTAGTSVCDVLSIRRGHDLLVGIQDRLDSDLLLSIKYNNYKKFGIVRNPFDRLISLYSYRKGLWPDQFNRTHWIGQTGSTERKYSFRGGSAYKWHPSLLEPDKIKNFEGWFWNFDVHKHMLTDPCMQIMNCYDCLCDVTGKLGTDYILKFENLNKDWEQMFNDLDIETPKLPKLNKSKHPHYSEFFNCFSGELIKEFIYSKFKKDFETFKYKYES